MTQFDSLTVGEDGFKEICTVGELSGGDVAEGRVGEGGAGGNASETTGSSGWAEDAGVTADGLFSALCLDSRNQEME